MKKSIALLLAISLLLAGCGGAAEQPTAEVQPQPTQAVEQIPTTEAPVATEPAEQVKIYPLTENGMDSVNDSILSVSLEEGGAYVDDTGKMQMDVTIYSYDRYDIADISMLKVGDVLVTSAGEVVLTSLDHPGDGSLSINGGLEAGGLELTHDDHSVFYQRGHNGQMNWYPIGEATLPVHTDFVYHDNTAQEETVYYAGSFLTGEVTDYDFTPHNTTIRVENGQIVEMHRF